ncbi:MAG TPA: nitroreductase family protein [Candidatus Hydrogenedentes bacterium]|nr:nitroreductase family protein [Candidatus Hydrogenedentota bacterium]
MAMTFDEIVRARHSVRAYDSERPVPEEHILAIAEAGRLAPSANNSQTWRFIAVTDRELLAQLSTEGMRALGANKFMREAPLIIVGCAKRDLLVNKVFGRIADTDYYQIDLGIAMEHMALKATELGLGTCWVGWFNEDRAKEILAIPEDVRVHVMLAVGYPRDPAAPQKPHKRKPLDRILFRNRWAETAETPE